MSRYILHILVILLFTVNISGRIVKQSDQSQYSTGKVSIGASCAGAFWNLPVTGNYNYPYLELYYLNGDNMAPMVFTFYPQIRNPILLLNPDAYNIVNPSSYITGQIGGGWVINSTSQPKSNGIFGFLGIYQIGYGANNNDLNFGIYVQGDILSSAGYDICTLSLDFLS